MSARLEVVILGCGSSAGVPRADGSWGRCDPADPRNRRSRCSLLARMKTDEGQGDETTILVDTAPELRLQLSAAGVRRLDAVLYTHDHADQAHGIDDLRAFWLTGRRKTPCYMDAATTGTLTRRFRYIFEDQPYYPAICECAPMPPLTTPWSIAGPSGALPIVAFDQDHGGVRSLGFRLGDTAHGGVGYCSDVVGLPPASLDCLRDLDVFIIDALRDAPHPTHANVAQALDWIEALKPRRAILTNLHHDLDYAELASRLPAGVEPAYDGMTLASS